MSHTKAVISTCIIALVWSLSGFNIKVIEWDPLSITAARSIIAVFIMGPFIVMKSEPLRLNGPMILCAISYTVFNYSFVFSTKLTTAAFAIMMQYTAPIYVVLFSWLLLHQRVRKKDLFFVILIVSCMLFSLYGRHIINISLGEFIAIFNGIAFAGISISLKLQKTSNPVISIFWGNIFSGIIGVPFVVFNDMPSLLSLPFLVLAGVISATTYAAYAYVSTNLSAIETVLIPIIDPVMNPVWVWIILGEKPCPRTIVTAIIILISVVIYNVHSIRRREEH